MINIEQGLLLKIKHVYTYTTEENRTERTMNSGLLTYV